VPVTTTKSFFESPLNWTTRSFIFAKQGEYEHRVNLGVGWPEAKKQLGKLAERGFGQGKGNLFFRMGLGSVAQVGRRDGVV
jgi:hypothetical protein